MNPSPHLLVNTRLEYGSAVHLVRLNSPDIEKVEMFNQTDQLPQDKADPPRVGKQWTELSFSEEIYGSGTAGTEPPLATALKACAWKAANDPGASETYSMNNNLSDDLTAATFDVYHGNDVKNSCPDSVGSMNFLLEPGMPGIFNFDFGGKYVVPSEAEGSASKHTGARPPVCVNLTATIGGKTLVLKKLEGGDGNTTDNPNPDLVEEFGIGTGNIVSKEPFITATFEFPDFSELNAVTSLLAETKLAISAVLGAVAGNIITFTMDGFLRANPENSIDSGKLIQKLDLVMSYQDGDDPLEIAFT